MRVTCVTIDCKDRERMVAFWSAALGYEVRGQSCYPPDGIGPSLEFIVVPEDKTVKNRVHLGFNTPDLDAEIERLVGLGATIAWEEDFPDEFRYRNVVLRDPEGNEFCLGTSTQTHVQAIAGDAIEAIDSGDTARLEQARRQLDVLRRWPG